ncbi:MAG: sodium:proton antiporter [Kofleriaceae bacterium]
MTSFQLIAVVLTLTAALAYLNTRLLRLPSSIGIMAAAMIGSLILIALSSLGLINVGGVQRWIANLDFGNTLLHGMLGLLLFAGALHIDLDDLGSEKVAIGTLAIATTLLSTAIVGVVTFVLLRALGVPVRLIEALLFGALISPTDPIAVLGVLKAAGAPRELEVRIAGESLFNDGVGVVIFGVLLSIGAGHGASASDIALLFVREAMGGAAFGLAIGYVGFYLLRSIDEYTTEVLITLALVTGGYAAAEVLHLSAPIAAVVAGLVVGNQGRRLAMSTNTRTHVDMFWKLIDEVLNAVLFLMIGLMVMVVPSSPRIGAAAASGVVIALAARAVSVTVSLVALRPFGHAPHSATLLTWGGLRGGISIAMALALPLGGARDIIVVMTYAVVAFAMLVQGLTFGPLLRRLHVCPPVPALPTPAHD